VPDAAGVGNDFERLRTSRNAIRFLRGPEPRFGDPHEPIQREPDDADGDDGQQDVRVDQAVVLLPEEAADARRAR
jgi:hypothetical protein